MKMKYLLAVLFLLTTFFIVGCGTEESGDEATAADSEGTEAESQETKIYTDATDTEVEIPINPERIVTTQYVDILLTLGITPVGAPSHVLKNEYLGELQDGIEDIGHPYSLEKIIAIEPDLIITSDLENIEELRKIAPTIVVPWNGDVYAQLNEIARILGKEQEATDWIANLEEKAVAIKTQVDTVVEEDEKVSIFMAYGKDTLRLYGGRNIGHIFYRLLDLTPPDYVQELIDKDPEYSEFVFEDISMEMLPEYAGDRIIMLVYDDEAANQGGMFHQIEESDLWKNLDAVKNDKVHYITPDPWFVYSPLAIEASLDQVVDLY